MREWSRSSTIGWCDEQVHALLERRAIRSLRRRGARARLLEHVIAFATGRVPLRHAGGAPLDSGAIRLYRKYGFRPVGVRPNYYVEDNEDAIVMLLELTTTT